MDLRTRRLIPIKVSATDFVYEKNGNLYLVHGRTRIPPWLVLGYVVCSCGSRFVCPI